MTITKNFERFQYFNSEHQKPFSKKADQCFIVKSAKIENVILWYKTAPSEANVKTNGTGTAKWTYHKEWSFASNHVFFWKFCFSLRASYKELIWCTNDPKCPYSYCSLALEFHLCVFFPVSILNRETNLTLLLPLEKIPIPICHVLREQFCCSCIYTKTERNRSQSFKETT